ncbi:hypothetical protein Tco_0697642 [Tanacetum coccineum]
MSTSSAHQQSLTDVRSKTRPPMLERGSYIPRASRFRRYLNQNRETRKFLNHSIDIGPYVFKMIQPNRNQPERPKTKDDLIGDNLKQYEADIEVMNLILISIPNDIDNSVDSCQTAKIEELSVNICMMAKIQPANTDSDVGPSDDSAFINEVQIPSTSYLNPLFFNSNHEQTYNEQPKIINSTIGDDQINSDIIFDDPNVEINSGSVEHDKNAHDSHDNEMEQLAKNAYIKAKKQQILEFTKQLEQYKEKVRVFEINNATKTNFHKEFIEADRRTKSRRVGLNSGGSVGRVRMDKGDKEVTRPNLVAKVVMKVLGCYIHSDKELEPMEASKTRTVSPSYSTAPLYPDHPLTHTSPTLTPSRASYYRSTPCMAMRTQPTLSLGFSARVTEAMTLSPLSFRKRYKSSYETPYSSASPASSDPSFMKEVVPIEDTIADEPLDLGYGAAICHALELAEGPVPDIEFNAPPVRAPVQTLASPEWSSSSLPVSPASLTVPSPVASLVTTPAATIVVDEEEFLEVGAQLELHGSILHDHTQRLDALPPTIFEGYGWDFIRLFLRSEAVRDEIHSQCFRLGSLERAQEQATITFGALWRPVLALEAWAGQTDIQRSALWLARY